MSKKMTRKMLKRNSLVNMIKPSKLSIEEKELSKCTYKPSLCKKSKIMVKRMKQNSDDQKFILSSSKLLGKRVNSICINSQMSCNQSNISYNSREGSICTDKRPKNKLESVGSMINIGYAHQHY